MSKILLIGEKDVSESIKSILVLHGFKVLSVLSGRDGIEQFKGNKDFDCVICDIRLPDMTGTAVTLSIRLIDPDMGTIILTSHNDVEEAIRAMREGAFNYLYKPVYSEKLVFSIENAIKRRRLVKENKRLNEDLLKKNQYFQRINDSAQQILLNMAPKTCPSFEKLETSAIYKSCEYVGGDMYDVFKLGQKIFFYVFDVCGHGILSAVMTMMMKATFQNLKFLYEHAGILPSLEKLIASLNQEMVRNTSSNIYVTLFAGVFDLDDHELLYISAGHIDQYLQKKEGIFPLSSTDTVIGIFEDVAYNPRKEQLEPGDRLFLFTDGIAEIWKKDVVNNTERMKKTIIENRSKPVRSVVQIIYSDILALYEDDKPDDDITLLGMEVLP